MESSEASSGWCTHGVKIELRPPEGVTGVALGATRVEAQEQCARLGDPEEFRRGGEGPVSLVVPRPSGLSLFVYFDGDDRVDAIEIGRPDGDEDSVHLGGLDVFTTPAEDLVEPLRGEHRVDVEDGGRSIVLPDLLIALWRRFLPEGPTDPEGRFFESVLVAAPGYYD